MLRRLARHITSKTSPTNGHRSDDAVERDIAEHPCNEMAGGAELALMVMMSTMPGTRPTSSPKRTLVPGQDQRGIEECGKRVEPRNALGA
jgi:hypothetical protein